MYNFIWPFEFIIISNTSRKKRLTNREKNACAVHSAELGPRKEKKTSQINEEPYTRTHIERKDIHSNTLILLLEIEKKREEEKEKTAEIKTTTRQV